MKDDGPVRDLERLKRQLDVGLREHDWAAVRAAGEALLAALGDEAPPEVRAGLHSLAGDAILSGEPAAADLLAARDHLRAAIAEIGQGDPRLPGVLMRLGEAELALSALGDAGRVGDALVAFEQILRLLPEEREPVACAEAHFQIAKAHEAASREDPTRLEAAVEAYEQAHRLFRASGQRRLNQGVAAFHVARLRTALFEADGGAEALAGALPYAEDALLAYRAAGMASHLADAERLLASIERKLEPGEDEAPQPQRGGTARLGLGLAATIRQSARSLFARLRGLFPGRRRDGLSAAEEARFMRAITEPELRRRLLLSWIEGHCSADEERAAWARETFIVPALSEAEAMRRRASRDADPDVLRCAEQHEAEARRFYEDLVRADRERSTHARALEILRDHVERGAGFVLFLRNYDLTLTKGRAPKSREHLYARDGMKVKHVNMVLTRRDEIQGRLAALVAPTAPVIGVADIGDVTELGTPGDLAKLRVLSSEWELVVSMLIAAAGAIVTFVHQVTDGVRRELDLIEQLGAVGRTSIVLVEPDDADVDLKDMHLDEFDKDEQRTAYEVLYEWFRRRFGSRLVQIERWGDGGAAAAIAAKVGASLTQRQA
ncbi:MAG: hypothetical protein AB1689_13700 [Thermodesulfobacteriota bacterium]